jgi:hypothetical protein
VESIGGMAAVGMAMVLLLRKQEQGCGNFLLLAMGFLGMGLLEIFHGAAPPGNGFVLLQSTASLVGSIGFALLCLPESSGNGLRSRWVPWLIPAGSLAVGAWTFLFPELIPEMARNGEFTAAAVGINLLACALFLAAAWRFFLDFHRSGRPEFYQFATLVDFPLTGRFRLAI